MHISRFLMSCGAVFMVSASVVPATAQLRVDQTNLVSDIPKLAQITDPALVNAWGISFGPMTPFWISDNGKGLSTLYSVPPSGPPSKVPLTVTIPPTAGGTTSAPTGQVFNGFGGVGFSGAAFLFDSEDGVISGWKGPGGTDTIVGVDKGSAAVYKGLAISDPGTSSAVLYATNFRAATIEAYNPSFGAPASVTGTFTDPSLPAGYAPFNDKVISVNGKDELYVTYAVQDAAKHDDHAGPGLGIVDMFNLDGTFDKRLISDGGALNSPWGLQIAPSSFGSFAGDLLVGNFGNGMINAYNATTGAFVGTLDGTNGSPLVIDGLWGLTIGNGFSSPMFSGGSLDTIYFTAGPFSESHGLFGSLTMTIPEPSTWALMALGFAGLGFAGWRSRRGSVAIAA
jgi:uncharacterized protein (TIGR03118 family)